MKNDNGLEKLLEGHYSSNPSLSPDDQQAVYVTPLEGEEQSRLFMFDLKLDSREEIELDIDNVKEKVKVKDGV